jgi:hypothetical protein
MSQLSPKQLEAIKAFSTDKKGEAPSLNQRNK